MLSVCLQTLKGVVQWNLEVADLYFRVCSKPVLNLKGTGIPVVEETKFLGIIFERKLSFIPHLRHLKDK